MRQTPVHRLSGLCPRGFGVFCVSGPVRVMLLAGRSGGGPWPAGAVAAGVVLGDVDADLLEFGQELADALVVVEPGGVVGGLAVAEDAGDGLAVVLAGPFAVGAVELRGVGVAAAVVPSALALAGGEGAGQGIWAGGEDTGDLAGDGLGAGMLVWRGRHLIIVAAGPGWTLPVSGSTKAL